MPLFKKRETADKLSQAKKEFLIGSALLVVGIIVWLISFNLSLDMVWLMIVTFLLLMSGVYIVFHAVLGLIVDLTVGFPAFLIGFGILIFAGALMSGYQLITAP